MGYLDFITDDRDDNWHRLYVGQCMEVLRRLVNGHAQYVLQASTSTLHYFIIWIGNGHRAANFIRLWSMEDEAEKVTDKLEAAKKDEWRRITMNLLEALFCQAFSTHHGILDRISPNSDAEEEATVTLQEKSSFGLNLMTPLAQNGAMIDWKRAKYLMPALKTPDEQILLWLQKFRYLKKKENVGKKLMAAPRPMFQRDFQGCLQAALKDEEFFAQLKASIRTELKVPVESTNTSSVPFFGSRLAKVGFILDYAAVSPEEDSFLECPDENDGLSFQLPASLKACNFQESNVLLWTFNFRKFLPLAAQASTIALGNDEQDELRRRHYELINSSQARIIFLCGARAETIMRRAFPADGQESAVSWPLHRFVLELRGFKYPMYITTDRRRIFIRCPPLPCQIWSRIGAESTQISEALRFAVSILGLYDGLYQDGIYCYNVETTCLIGSILRQARTERLGKVKLTVDKLDPSILLWLQHKGLKTKTVEKIAGIAKSVTRGLLMILHALPRNPSRSQSAKRASAMDPDERQARNQKRVKAHERFDPEGFQQVTEIVQESIAERERAYATALEKQPPKESSQADPSPEICSLHDVTNPATAEVMENIQNIIALEQDVQPAHPSHTTSSEQGLLADPLALPSQPEESHILDLEPFYKESIDLGLLSLEVPKARRDRPGFKGHVWRQEVGKFHDKEYRYAIKNPRAKNRAININYCHVSFAEGEDIGDGLIRVQIQIVPPGQRHENCYAAGASDSDPASRLAFRLRYVDSQGTQQERFAHAGGERNACAANTLVDILVDDKPYEVIAKSPRRYLYFTGESKISPELKRFIGGGYTDT